MVLNVVVAFLSLWRGGGDGGRKGEGVGAFGARKGERVGANAMQISIKGQKEAGGRVCRGVLC